MDLSNKLADTLAREALKKITHDLKAKDIVNLHIDTIFAEVIPFTERIETTLVKEYQKVIEKAAAELTGETDAWDEPPIDDLIE